jgi:hypothetical protein
MLQHVIVLTLVAGSVAYLARGLIHTLRAKKSGFGKCCATGCDPSTAQQQQQGGSTERLVFLPVESLKRRRT